MCNCYDEVKGKLLEHAKAKAPEGAHDFDIELGGYIFGVTDEGITHRSSNAVTFRYKAPKKAGGMKNVTDKTFVRATYCPYCGLSYQTGKPAEAKAEEV